MYLITIILLSLLCFSVRVSKYLIFFEYLIFLMVSFSVYEKRIVSLFVSLSFGYYFYTFASLSMRVYNSVPRGVYTYYTRNVFHSSSHHWRREYNVVKYRGTPATRHTHAHCCGGHRDSWGHGMGAAARRSQLFILWFITHGFPIGPFARQSNVPTYIFTS